MKREEGSQYELLLKHIQELEHETRSQARQVRALEHQLSAEKTLSSERQTQLKTIQTLHLGVFSGLEESEIFQIACQSAVSQVGWDVSFVLTIKGGRGAVLASYNATNKQLEHLADNLHQNALITDAYVHHRAVMTFDAEQHQALVLRSLFQADSVAMLPILFGDHCYGYLVACDTHGLRHATRHHREDVDFLASMASMLAYAVQQSTSLLTLEEQNKRLRQLDELKDSFISITSHQLRTPLSIVKWILSILQGDKKIVKLPEQHKMIAQAYETNERLIHVVNDLLNVSRIQEGKLPYNPQAGDVTLAVSELVENAKQLFANKGVKLELSLEKKMPIIDLDPILFKEAVQNIVDNALDYNVDSKPWVKIATFIEKKDEKSYAVVAVTNPGIGISEEDKDKIFEQFYRAPEAVSMHPNGNGLGLFLAKAIIAEHKGELLIESIVNTETTVSIKVPIPSN